MTGKPPIPYPDLVVHDEDWYGRDVSYRSFESHSLPRLLTAFVMLTIRQREPREATNG